jgi:hypothetical protein
VSGDVTEWENRIIELFLERYPKSAAARGGRALRIKAVQLFPDFEKAPPDERISFLEAAESLEKRRILSLVWVRRRKHEILSAAVCPRAEALFSFAGKPSPSVIAEEARKAARESAADTNTLWSSFFTFIAETLTPEDAARGINLRAVQDMALLAQRCVSGEKTLRGITPRALSVLLYKDSKRLETLFDLFSRITSRAARQSIPIPDFSFLNRAFPETLKAGKLAFTL